MEKIDAIILAGGLGTRLRDVVDDRPKVLAQVKNRPFLDFILDALSSWNHVSRVVLAVGYMSERVIEHYGRNRNYPFEIEFSVEKKLLGTGGAIKQALSLTRSKQVIVLNGDSFVEVDLNKLLNSHVTNGQGMTLTMVEVDNASRFGRVVSGSDGKIISFLEKSADSAAGFINAGVYLIERDLFDDVAEDTVVSLERDLMPVFLKRGIYGHKTTGKFIDIGTPDSYGASNSFFEQHRAKQE
ncbi:MAG: hypothetical protein ACD_39C01350G0003 [uncultured bacterium]|nr:MAG: hypothetical protein ACD_39C01350G0003 [uncultured bacterium]